MTDPKPPVGQQAETEVSYCCERLHDDGWHAYLSHADREKVLDYVRGDQGFTRLVRVETTRTVEISRSVYGDGRIEELPVAVTLSEGQDKPTLFQEVEAHRKELIVENLKLKETLADILAWIRRTHRKEKNRADEAYNRALSVVEMYIEERTNLSGSLQVAIPPDASVAVQGAMMVFNKKMRAGQDTQEKKS